MTVLVKYFFIDLGLVVFANYFANYFALINQSQRSVLICLSNAFHQFSQISLSYCILHAADHTTLIPDVSYRLKQTLKVICKY